MTNRERAAAAPELPTVAQAGYPELEFDGLVGLFGPGDMASDLAIASPPMSGPSPKTVKYRRD